MMGRISFYIAGAVLVAVFIFSLTPQIIKMQHHADKWVHICAYATMMACICQGVRPMGRILTAALFLFLVGGMIEILQYLIGGREASVLDMAANAIGIAFGILCGCLIRRGLDARP